MVEYLSKIPEKRRSNELKWALENLDQYTGNVRYQILHRINEYDPELRESKLYYEEVLKLQPRSWLENETSRLQLALSN